MTVPHTDTDISTPSAAFLAGLTLHPIQAHFIESRERFAFFVGGVGSGKSTAGAVRALARALDHPGSLGLIGAPTYPMLRDATLRTVFTLLEGTEYAFHKSELRLTLPNGAEILFRSLDEPDRVRGLSLAWFWLDEAPLCGYYAWQILKGRLRQSGFEHETAGWATGTPHGRDGYWRDFEHTPRPGHALYRAATYANAANLPPDYITDLGLSGALYDQEVLGLFTAFAGLVYPFQADADGNLWDGETESPSFREVIGGVDWGYTNPTAAVIFGLDGDGRAWQLDEWYERRAPFDAVVLPALVDLTRRWGVARWYCGPDEPEHIAALRTALLLANLSCRVEAAEDAIRPGIQTVLGLLAKHDDGTRGLSVARRCVHTIAEYGSYQYPPEPQAGYGAQWAGSPTGGFGEQRGLGAEASELPLKQNDHALDATRYALHTHLRRARATDAWLEVWLTRRLRAREAQRQKERDA